MITIDFFDANGRFVVRHKIELDKPRKFPFLLAKVYVSAIFYWYESAFCAVVKWDGKAKMVKRYE